jgi:hypothetical protein
MKFALPVSPTPSLPQHTDPWGACGLLKSSLDTVIISAPGMMNVHLKGGVHVCLRSWSETSVIL